MIVDGEPNAGGERECFPPALRHHEPIAADARAEGDGKHGAKVKLLAGMLGVSFDALRQRDAQRRIRRLESALVAALVLIVCIGALAWHANQQKLKAIKARAQSEAILGYLLYDLRDMLEPLDRLDIVRDVQARVDRYYEELGVESDNANIMSNRAVAYLNEGARLFSEGKFQPALKSFQQSMQLVQRLATADPKNTNWQWFLSGCQARVGNVLAAQGDLAGALCAHREGLTVRQWLATAQPSNAAWQRGLSQSHNHVGDVLTARGDLAEALREYREGLAICQRLADADPGLADFQQDLVDSLCKVAGALERQGDPESTKYWQRASDVLSEMKRAGRLMSPDNERMLRILQEMSRKTTKTPQAENKAEIRDIGDVEMAESARGTIRIGGL